MGTATVPATVGIFAEAISAQTLAVSATTSPTVQTAPPATAQPAGLETPSPDEITASTRAFVPAAAAPAGTAALPLDEAELTCIAKVVHHEAGGEPRAGQLAVAQLIIKRMKSGRFPGSACGVANQRGQFFDTASYHPAQGDARWTNAIEVSREAMTGMADEVAPGAMFFRSAAGSPTSFFRSRERVATIGHQVFYR